MANVETTIVKLEDGKLKEAWDAAIAAEEALDPATRASLVERAERGWFPWSTNKIWVRNTSGHEVLVLVQRTEPIKQLMEVALKAGVQSSGATIESALKYAELKLGLQKETMQPDQLEPNGLMFHLGAHTQGALVTVALKDDMSQLICKDRMVPTRHCIVLGSSTFRDPDSVLHDSSSDSKAQPDLPLQQP